MGKVCDLPILFSSRVRDLEFELQVIDVLESLSIVVNESLIAINNKIEQEKNNLKNIEEKVRFLEIRYQGVLCCSQGVGNDNDGEGGMRPFGTAVGKYKPICEDLERALSKSMTRSPWHYKYRGEDEKHGLDDEFMVDEILDLESEILLAAKGPGRIILDLGPSRDYFLWSLCDLASIGEGAEFFFSPKSHPGLGEKKSDFQRPDEVCLAEEGRDNVGVEECIPTLEFPETLPELSLDIPKGAKSPGMGRSDKLEPKPSPIDNDRGVDERVQFAKQMFKRDGRLPASSALLEEIRKGKRLASTEKTLRSKSQIIIDKKGIADILFEAIASRRKGIMARVEEKVDTDSSVFSANRQNLSVVMSIPSSELPEEHTNFYENEEWNT